jgi:ubiquinone/menaquinone biosynthesis C-methylase UbiE
MLVLLSVFLSVIVDSSSIKSFYKTNINMSSCQVCGIIPPTKLKQCSKCRSVYYCGQTCQIKDWPMHKRVCTVLAETPMITTSVINTTTSTDPKHQTYEPDDTSEYKKQSYWDSRFLKEEEFDWLGKYSDIKDYVAEYMKDKSMRIMVLGCGNSTLSDDLHKDGFTNVLSMDYSPVVIEKMKRKYPHLQWIVMDVCDMSAIETDSFDMVIDKGVMDALVTDEGDPWRPKPEVVEYTRKMCREVYRIMRPNGGIFVQISFAQPHFRRLYLIPETDSNEQRVTSTTVPKELPSSENCIGWKFRWSHLPSIGFGYFIYIMEKNKVN